MPSFLYPQCPVVSPQPRCVWRIWRNSSPFRPETLRSGNVMKGGKRKPMGNLIEAGLFQQPHPSQGCMVARLEHMSLSSRAHEVRGSIRGLHGWSSCFCTLTSQAHDGRNCPEFCRKTPSHHLYLQKKRQAMFFAVPCQSIGVSTFETHSSRTAALGWWT